MRNIFLFFKKLAKYLNSNINYAWYFPKFLKYFLISNQVLSRHWYLKSLPEKVSFISEASLLKKITEKSISYFDGKLDLPKYCEISYSNTYKNSNNISKQAYRFIINPLIAIPELKEFLVEKTIRRILSKVPELKIVGINLRISDGNLLEEKTTCFHRDFNGFQTIKIFIPLLSSEDSFLEYYPGSVLKNPFLPFYCPKHIAINKLKRKYKYIKSSKISSKIYEASILNTSCIHREMPSSKRRITIILTLLPHLDYARNGLRINSNDYGFFKINRFNDVELINI